MNSAVYAAGIRPEQFDHFTLLQKTAGRKELLELTGHPNGVVRCYAFWSLSRDSSGKLLPVILQHLDDDEPVYTLFGCIASTEKTGDFFISIATQNYFDAHSGKLKMAELHQLDSILIFRNNNLDAKDDAIFRSQPTEDLYVRIKELAVKEHDQAAIVALARYRKPQDIALILNNKFSTKIAGEGYFYTYQAIAEFPAPEFIPLLGSNLEAALKDTHWSGEWRELYNAIASYRDQKAIELLRKPFTKVKHENIRTCHIDFIYSALRHNICALYEDLLWTMWKNEQRITPDVFDYLLEKNPERVSELSKKSLLDQDASFEASASFEYERIDTNKNMASRMLGLLMKKDRSLAYRIIIKNIRATDVLQFPVFANIAASLHDKIFVEPLFERLAKESNPHVYLKITQVLIAYNDSKINKRIADARKINKEMQKDWGGQAFDKLLADNGIK